MNLIKALAISLIILSSMFCSLAIPKPFTDIANTPSTAPLPVQETPQEVLADEIILYVTADYVNLRTIPDAYSEENSVVLAILQRGDALKFIQCASDNRGNSWIFVRSIRLDQVGWVIAEYVSPNVCK